MGGRQTRQVVAGDLLDAPLAVKVDPADRFDLIAEEFYPNGQLGGGREDVNDAAATGELPLLFDLLDAIETAVGQPADQFLHLHPPA